MSHLTKFTIRVITISSISLMMQGTAQAASVDVQDENVRPAVVLPVGRDASKLDKSSNVASSSPMLQSSVVLSQAISSPERSEPLWTVEALPVPIVNPTDNMVVQDDMLPPTWIDQSSQLDVTAFDRTELNPEENPVFLPPLSSIPPVEISSSLPSPAEVEILQRQLEGYESAPQRWTKRYKSSPGITLSVPSGFGADRGRKFFGIGLQRTRVDTNDGAAGIGIGLGNARKGLGVQISYTSTSISPSKLFRRSDGNDFNASSRPFGSGGFNLKIHRQSPDGLSVAVGADSIISIGPRTAGVSANSVNGTVQNEFEGTYYAAATKLFKLKPDATESFSRLAVTVGAGTGRFQPTQTLVEGKTVITPFASAALKISPAASVIAEWTGQDFGVGLSWVPFRNLPIVVTPGIRDLFGPDAERPRFVLGIGTSF